MPGLPIATIPHPMAGQSEAYVAGVAEQAYEEVLHILTAGSELLEREYRDKTIQTKKKSRLKHKAVFGDEFSVSEADGKIRAPESLDAVNRIFYHRGWTDGLPIIPPSVERIDNMLRHTGFLRETFIGKIAPKNGDATVEKIAANAVMAGCLPEHLPVVVAATRAMTQKALNLYALQTTTHPCTVLVFVSGPLSDALDINSGYNAMGQGSLGNAAIGRAVRLLLINVGGASPGVLDRATHGSPGKYSFCFAENESENPWEPFHVEKGFAEATTVTVAGTEGPHNVNDHGGKSGEEILMTVAGGLATPCSNNAYLRGEPMIVLGPEHAAVIARDGFSKKAVKAYLFEHARVPISSISKGNLDWFTKNHPTRFEGLTKQDKAPLVDDPGDFIVVVSGGMGRHSVVIPTFGGHTRSVTVPVTDSRGKPILPEVED
jgi:hypothetical protein